jgi:hypothetical protein
MLNVCDPQSNDLYRVKIQYVYFNFRNIFSPLRTKSPPPDMVINGTRLLMVLYLQTTTLVVVHLHSNLRRKIVDRDKRKSLMPNVGKKENENYFMLSIPIFTANGGLYKRVPNLKDFVLNGYKCFAALRLTAWLRHIADIDGFTYCYKIVRTRRKKMTHVADYSVDLRIIQ